jgi:hypothetical protein
MFYIQVLSSILVTSKDLRSPLWLDFKPLRNFCVTNDHGYISLVVSTVWFFPRVWFNNSNTKGVTSGAGTACPSRSPEFTPVFNGVALLLVFCVVLYRSLCVVFLLDHCVVCYFYGFWLPLCHLQNLIISFWDLLALVALWWCTAKVTFRNPGISLFSYLIKKIVYWLGSMFGVGDTKYMREAWWPSSSPSQWIDGWALVGELQPLLWRVIKQMLYNNFLGNLRMAHFQWKFTFNFPESSPYTLFYCSSFITHICSRQALFSSVTPTCQ